MMERKFNIQLTESEVAAIGLHIGLRAEQIAKDPSRVEAYAVLKSIVDKVLPALEHLALGTRMPSSPANVAWKHAANEWADMATAGLVWLRNIRDGISKPEEAINNMEGILLHCRRVDRQTIKEVGE